jgi:hypothetical protein
VTVLFAPEGTWTGSPVAEYEDAPVPVIDERLTLSGLVPGLDTTISDDSGVPIWTSPKAIVEPGPGVDAKTGATPVHESG